MLLVPKKAFSRDRQRARLVRAPLPGPPHARIFLPSYNTVIAVIGRTESYAHFASHSAMPASSIVPGLRATRKLFRARSPVRGNVVLRSTACVPTPRSRFLASNGHLYEHDGHWQACCTRTMIVDVDTVKKPGNARRLREIIASL
jgi:hypothetical protein